MRRQLASLLFIALCGIVLVTAWANHSHNNSHSQASSLADTKANSSVNTSTTVGTTLGKAVTLGKMQNGDITINAESMLIGDNLLQHHLTVYAKGRAIFADTNHLFSTAQGILPLVRPISSNRYEILLGVAQGYEHSTVLRLIANHTGILQQDTLPMFDSSYTDIDDDMAVEFGGFLLPHNTYCSHCDSTYYNPMLIYEASHNGFRLDEVATYDWIIAHYGIFHGFAPQADLVVPIQTPQIKAATASLVSL